MPADVAAPPNATPAPAPPTGAGVDVRAPAGANGATGPQTPAPPAEPAKVDPATAKPDAKSTALTLEPAAEVALKLPEGIDPKDPQLEAFRAIIKADGLKSETAQKIADLYFGAQKAALDGAFNSETNQKAWAESLRADKNFETDQKAALRVMSKYGQSPGLRKLLVETGLGDHPELFKLMASIGKDMAEDTVAGAASASVPGGLASAFDSKSWYPNTKTPGFHKE